MNTDKCMNTQAHVNTQPRRTWSCLLIILPVLGRGVCWASGRGVCWASGRGVCWAPRKWFLFNNPFIVAVLGAHIASRLSTSTPGGFVFFILPSPPRPPGLSQICSAAPSSWCIDSGRKTKSVSFPSIPCGRSARSHMASPIFFRFSRKA